MAMSRCRDVPAETGPTKKRPPFLERKKQLKQAHIPGCTKCTTVQRIIISLTGHYLLGNIANTVSVRN